MKLLFNKDTQWDKELKSLIPYADKDLKYQNLIPDIETATQEVIKIISEAVYNIAIDVYWNDTNELDDEKQYFIRVITYPIAVNAYRLYAPTNDLAHTNNGRKMRGDDSEKNPFEWMIDRDNAAQEKRYYRALESLVNFLNTKKIYETPNQNQILENSIANAWRGSKEFNKLHSLFITTVDDFDKHFPLNSLLLLIKLSPGMDLCERSEILPRIGKAKYDELKNKQKNAQPIDDKGIELLHLIQKAIAFYAMAWSMTRFSVNLYPDGILQHYTSDKATTRGQKPALNLEAKAAEMAFMSDAENIFIKIEQLLTPIPIITETINQYEPPKINYGTNFISSH